MPPKKKPKTKEEIKEQKRIAERLRYQRLKNDPVKREQLKEKERRNYQRKKEKGTRKLVKDMSRREHKAVTKEWRKHCATYRAKKKALKEITNNFVRQNTPESEGSPSPQSSTSPSILPMTTPRSDASNARKRNARKNRVKIIKDKDKKIEYYKKKSEKYRKRLERLEKAKTKENVDTPNTKFTKMCDSPETRREVVKKALFGEVLNAQLKENYANLKTCKEKQIFGKVVSGKLIHKYKLWRSKDSAISYKIIQKSPRQSGLVPKLRTRKDKISSDCITTVRAFYENDDNSRLGAGKRECLTRKGVKKQKRYLSDSIANLYKKFQAEHFKISYTTFCRLRPFWVITPNVNERDTCLCIKHANIDLKLSALHRRRILTYNSHTALLEKTCCNRYDELCLSRTCQRCIDKNPDYREFDDSKPIEFKKWISEKQTYNDPKTKNARTVTKYLKKTFTVRPRELIEELHEDLEAYYQHERNITHQYNAIKKYKQNLTDEDAIIHMDFSENYCSKYGQEIQAFHFGGSRLQLSLHTVVVYTKNSIKSYCTVSKNLTHSPAAIWAHLRPIFKTLPPNIKSIHFVSDGPVTQYKNKTMFYILASRLQQEVLNVKKFTWNYSESGHGKGAPDGIGATCKRTADAVVATGGDIDSLESFVEAIQGRCSAITLFTIDDKAIQELADDLQNETVNLKSFNGTLKIHQVKAEILRSPLESAPSAAKLIMKSLSCTCEDECQHFNLGVLQYKNKTKLNVDDIYTDSESEKMNNSQDSTRETDDAALAGPSSINQQNYTIGDYVLVKFLVRNTEYCYAAVINKIDTEEGELTVTFLKICDDKGHTFRVDENDVSDVSFDQVLKKLPNPDIALKGKRIFYYFNIPVPVFEK